jgi:endoglucanase
MLTVSRSGPFSSGTFAFAIVLALSGCSTSSAPYDDEQSGGGFAGTAGASATGGSGQTGGTNAAGGSDTTGGTAGVGGGTTGGTSGTGGASSGKDAAAAVAEMRLGWNLGNSLDAVGGETNWGNPRVSKALVEAVAGAGFGVVRIPVTWTRHFGAAPTYTIDATWMSRVAEVVGYVLDSGMYALINVHHDGGDGGWLSILDSQGQLTDAHTNAVRTQFVAIWSQIALHFRDHGDRLVFESMNEVKVDYNAPNPAWYPVVNGLNQAFVDTVRASGGNNGTRLLLVPGYNTNINYTVAGFVRPTDPAPDRLILSVHYYDPWSFAGAGTTHTWGASSPGRDNWGQESHVNEQFTKLKTTFIDKGLPVIIGEYGAVNQTGYEKYRRYYMEYVTKAAYDRGIVPVFWDNGSLSSGGEAFGLMNRSNNTVAYPVILDAMVRAVTSGYTIDQIAPP